MREDIVVSFDYPPIPIRDFDYSATLRDADENGPVGYGATEAEAVADLLDQLEEMED